MHVRVLLAVNAALLGALTVASGETINFVGMPLTIELDPSHSVPTWVGYAGALVPTLNTTSPGSIVDNPASGSSYGRCIYYGNGNLAFDPSSFASYPGSWQAGDEYTFHFDGVVSNNTTFRMEFSNEAGAVGGLLGLQFEIVNGAFNGSDAIQIYSYGGTSTTLFNNANIGGAAGVGLPQRVIGNLTVTILNGTSASVSGSVADSLGNLWTGPSTTINLGTAPASLFAGVNLNSGAGVSGITTLSWSLTPDRFRLNLRTNGNGDLTRSPIETAYLSNSIVTLTATPNAGWAFMGWSDDASGTSNPLNVMMTTNNTITANFGLLPTISVPPGDITVHQGSNATFTITANSALLPFGYQWQFNGSPIPGANASNYTRVAAQGSDAGNYTVVVTNAVGSVTSAVAVLTVIVPPPGVIAQWNFNSFPPDGNSTFGTTAPAYGSGAASLAGGTTATFVTGDTIADPAGSTDNSAWDTTSYPGATAANKTAGMRFDVSTAGYKNISVSWQQRVSSQASKYARLQYTTNGTTFLDFPTAIAMSSVGSFESKSNNLAAIPAVNDKTNFGLRLVTEFESTATGAGQARYVTVSGGYSSGADVVFDMVTIYGQPLSAPATLYPLSFAVGNYFQLGVTGAAGSSYVLQLSTNLATTNWLPVQTNASPFIFTESNTIAPQRFYRALFLQ